MVRKVYTCRYFFLRHLCSCQAVIYDWIFFHLKLTFWTSFIFQPSLWHIKHRPCSQRKTQLLPPKGYSWLRMLCVHIQKILYCKEINQLEQVYTWSHFSHISCGHKELGCFDQLFNCLMFCLVLLFTSWSFFLSSVFQRKTWF